MTAGILEDEPQTRPAVFLLPGRHRRAEGGSPWIYSNEIRIDAEAKALAAGALVTLRRADEGALGVAIFNPHTLIAARLLDRDAERPIGARFFARRFERALGLREKLFEEPYYRLVHAEADGLPGLVVDRFGGVVVIEENTAGMDRLEPVLLDALEGLLKPKATLLKNDTPARALEGLPLETKVARGALEGRVLVREGGALFPIDPLAGQKTGWFFDQRENRAFLSRLAKGGRVLDLYCGVGGFAIAAARAGASEVVGVDRSEFALGLAREAARLNEVEERTRFSRGEAFAEASRLAEEGVRFDLVIADPPAFAKSKKDVGAALRGYRKLARLSARLVARAGFLFVASCSYHTSGEEFGEAVRRGLLDAGRGARILRIAGAGPDHPIHPALPETAYLKTLTLALD